MRWIACSFVVALAAGCVPLPVNRVNRAAFVPHITPVTSSGAAMEAPAELRLGATSVGNLRDPKASDPDAAVEVPGTQLAGGLRVRVGGVASIGFTYERGLASTATKGKSTQVPVDGGDVIGMGMTFTAAIPIGGRWSVGLAGELLGWEIPWVEYSACVENCVGDPTRRTTGEDLIGQFGFAFVPTYRGDRATWFAGATMRNHPTIVQKDQELGYASTGDVEGGPKNVVLSAGVEAELGAGIRGSLILYAPVDHAQPLDYGPSLSAGLIIPLGPRTIAAAARL